MKKLFLMLLSLIYLSSAKTQNNTLLWKVSGNGLSRPSYIFGTMHIVCREETGLSDSVKDIIKRVDDIYFEIDMDDSAQLLESIGEFKMKNGATLKNLTTPDQYEKIKNYYTAKGQLLQFEFMKDFKPMLLTTLLQAKELPCRQPVAVEQLVMEANKSSSKEIKGLETLKYQASLFDSIPYKTQVKQLLDIVEGRKEVLKETAEMSVAYKKQDLKALEHLIIHSCGEESAYMDLLVTKRNKNWTVQLQQLFPQRSVLLAVGAGHLPGKEGILNLLSARGYKIEPVKNEMRQPPSASE